MRRVLRFVPLLMLLHLSGFAFGEQKCHTRLGTHKVAIKVADESFDFVMRPGELEIFIDGKSFAIYVWSDPRTTRPYFKQVKALRRSRQTDIIRQRFQFQSAWQEFRAILYPNREVVC